MKLFSTLFELKHIKKITFLFILLLAIARVGIERKTYPAGDALEYSLMTEAIFNHFSSNIKASDYESFKNTFTKTNKWEANEKFKNWDLVKKYIYGKDYKPFYNEYGIYVDNKGNKYSCHFWFYSLLNIPIRFVCAIFPFNPFVIFYITNIILLVITCFIFLKTSPFNNYLTSVFCFIFFFSTNFWYLNWPHPEIFSTCFVALGIWFFLLEKRYLGIILISIASMQNQPLAMMLFILAALTLFKNGITIKNILLITLCSFPVFIPSLFYYSHFGVSNLIQNAGALSTNYITFTRVFGFFFDLNQGMILAYPLILILYLVLITTKLFNGIGWKQKLDLLLLPAIILMACGASTINNWNSGQAVVSRYVCYIGGAMLVHFFFLLMEIDSLRRKQLIISIALFIQIITVVYFQKITAFDLHSCVPKPFANWVLQNYPHLYNPDPIIFITRYGYGIENNKAESPAYVKRNDKYMNEITKFLVHRKHLHNLKRFGFSQKQIDSLAPTLHYINDWAYINTNANFKANQYNANLIKIKNDEEISNFIKLTKLNTEKYILLQQAAGYHRLKEEDVLLYNAIHTLYNAKEIETNLTKEERVNYFITSIKMEDNWYYNVKDKAARDNLPLETALLNEAQWKAEEEAN